MGRNRAKLFFPAETAISSRITPRKEGIPKTIDAVSHRGGPGIFRRGRKTLMWILARMRHQKTANMISQIQLPLGQRPSGWGSDTPSLLLLNVTLLGILRSMADGTKPPPPNSKTWRLKGASKNCLRGSTADR